MHLSQKSTKEIGVLGENCACEYLCRHGFTILGRNISRKTGELDIVARKRGVIHIIEVKSVLCGEFPSSENSNDRYDPSDNLHMYKIQKVARTAQWYIANIGWEGEWQIDAILVWLRESDSLARVRYLPQIL